MKIFSRLLLATIYFCSTLAFAQERSSASIEPSAVAEIAAKWLNEIHDWEGLLKAIEMAGARSQANAIREFLSGKVDLKTPFPKYAAQGNQVVWMDHGKNLAITLNQNNTFNFDGQVFRPPNLNALDRFVEESFHRLTASKNSWYSFFILPASAKANAMENEALIFAAGLLCIGVAMLFLPGLGAVFGIAATKIVGMLFASLSIYTFVYIGINHIYQKHRDGEVSCDGDAFVLRFQPNNQLFSNAEKLPEKTILTPKDAKGNRLPCTEESAKDLQDALAGVSRNLLEIIKKSPNGVGGLPDAPDALHTQQ